MSFVASVGSSVLQGRQDDSSTKSPRAGQSADPLRRLLTDIRGHLCVVT